MLVEITKDMNKWEHFSHLNSGTYSCGNSYFNKSYGHVMFHHPNNTEHWHRLDGPASIWTDGQIGWWFNNCNVARYNIKKHKTQMSGPLVDWAKDNGIDLSNLTDSDVDMIKLCWGDYAG